MLRHVEASLPVPERPGLSVAVVLPPRKSLDPHERAVRVFLADAHDVIRRGVAAVLEADPGIRVVGEARGFDDALRRIPAVRPDVAIVGTARLCEHLSAAVPGLRCLMLARDASAASAGGVRWSGAAGVLVEDVSSAELVAAVHSVVRAQNRLAPATSAPATNEAEGRGAEQLTSLTAREREVLRLLGVGLTNRAIAARLRLTEKTVKNYVTHLLAKLGLANRTQAAILATRVRGGETTFP